MPDGPASGDLSWFLSQWPYAEDGPNVRLVDGEDGQQRLQVRLDLGVLQMFLDGPPDGTRPHGYDSLLEYHEARRDDLATRGEGEEQEASEVFSLEPEACQALREEAARYYQRYMALLVLEDYGRVVRDTTRNLRLLDLCAAHAQTESDRQALEPYRPYILMVRARAIAGQAIKDDEPKAAVYAIDQGLEALLQYFTTAGEPELFEQSTEVQLLRSMRDSLVPRLPMSQRTELRERLQRALAQENYELAAILRDELDQLKE